MVASFKLKFCSLVRSHSPLLSFIQAKQVFNGDLESGEPASTKVQIFTAKSVCCIPSVHLYELVVGHSRTLKYSIVFIHLLTCTALLPYNPLHSLYYQKGNRKMYIYIILMKVCRFETPMFIKKGKIMLIIETHLMYLLVD